MMARLRRAPRRNPRSNTSTIGCKNDSQRSDINQRKGTGRPQKNYFALLHGGRLHVIRFKGRQGTARKSRGGRGPAKRSRSARRRLHEAVLRRPARGG